MTSACSEWSVTNCRKWHLRARRIRVTWRKETGGLPDGADEGLRCRKTIIHRGGGRGVESYAQCALLRGERQVDWEHGRGDKPLHVLPALARNLGRRQARHTRLVRPGLPRRPVALQPRGA